MMLHSRISTCILAAAVVAAGSGHAAADMTLRQTFSGMCDASAAVVLDSSHFLLFDDEKKNPHVFDVKTSAFVDEVKIKSKLDPIGDEEFDFEGAALIGDTIVGITSHGRKKSGEEAPARRRLFAFTVTTNDGHFERDRFDGYRNTLIDDFAAKFPAADYDLVEAAKHEPESAQGLNIEGVAAWKDSGVIIGLRGPLFENRALLIPILNAVDYIKGAAPDFGAPIPLALDGRGIRDIARIGDRYLIIGGPSASDTSFALYAWSGDPDDHEGKKLTDLVAVGAKPEAVLSMDGGKTVSVLSDDGDHIADTLKKCSKLDGAEEVKRQFRMFDVPLAE